MQLLRCCAIPVNRVHVVCCSQIQEKLNFHSSTSEHNSQTDATSHHFARVRYWKLDDRVCVCELATSGGADKKERVLYVVTDLARCSLLEYMREEKLHCSLSQRLGYGLDVLRALQQLHHLNCTHNDLRPEMILVRSALVI